MATMASSSCKPRVSKIVGIQFSILSPEEIRKGSVTEITSRDTYVGNKPVIGGLFCPYMGVSEPGMLCPTDGLDYMNTPGYFGRIELAAPVFYYQHLATVHKILRCVCIRCSKLLIDKNAHKQALKMMPDERWAYVFGAASKVKRCGDDNQDGCGCLMPKKIRKENLATLIAEWESDGVKGMSEEDAKKMNMLLTPEIVLKIFRRISDDDVSFMGFSPAFSRPDWMICQVLAVPPPAVRPSIKMDGQQRSEDDLTHIIVNIVKANKTLQEKIRDGAQANIIADWHTVLQYYCATLVDNNIPGAAPVAQRSGRPLKSIKERLNGKGGRVRGNLMGKRVDFSARSVITPDPNLSIRELGVPLKIAKNITKPVVVNDMNRRVLTKLVRNGPEEYPGAKILERKGGESISLRYADRENIVLYNGDIVHRHMMDGDGVLFNRQPTLHRMSMMCHIARIMHQGDTFRMNVGDTKPYNADFDGDEMNMHMPQDEEAEAELKNLAAVPYQIISPAKNQSIIGIFQDSLLGSYRFTRPGVSFTPRDAMNLLMAYNGVNEGLFAGHAERITSFQILSQIMPAFTMKYKTKGFGENDDFATSPGVLEIVDGKYLRGQLDKDVLGGGSNGLITRTCNDFGNMAASDFIDNLQNIVTEYMKGSAYSVGISDLIANRSTNELITQSITAKKKEVKNLIDQTYLGIFENTTGNTNEDEFEFQVTNILNKATNDSGNIGVKSLDKDNRFVTMVKAGSKGQNLNISQMIACLGQQLIDGKRIPYGFENRTLPHFTKYDDSPSARGFVENSFISGLTPEELFFHAMGGRVGLIDTAVKTSSTGYIQRRLIKGMEDLKIEYDMTVRNNKGRVIQFSYGEDGIDPVKVESQIMPLVNLGLDEIYAHYHMPSSDPKDVVFTAAFTKGVISRMKKQKAENDAKCKHWIDFMIEQREKIIQRVFRSKNNDRVFLPVAFAHTINNVKGLQQINNNSIVDITPLEAFAMIEAAYKRLESMHYCAPTELFKAMYFYYLSPKDLLMVKRFNKKALSVLLEMIVLKYKNSLIAPGEMVGMISAQSIGEPTTQLTLNSVSYDTRVMLRIDGQIKVHQIGEYIDQYIEKAERMEDHPNDTKLGYINADEDVFIPSVDALGITSWKRVEAVTRHPVVNVDGTNTVLRVTTEDGRQVIATKAKSFLSIDAKNQLAATNGSDLKIGDYIPINQRAFEMPENDSFDVSIILKKSEYSFGSEIMKALSYCHERNWWANHANIDFVVPYARSDSLLEATNCKCRQGANTKQSFETGIVYLKHKGKQSRIPEKIPYDFEFGYLIGAYCAEGCMTKTQISISNNDVKFFEPINTLMLRWGITTKYYVVSNKNGQEGWTSSDLRIYSKLLTEILNALCGKGSDNKFIHPELLNGNKEFMRGVLSGYFGGDGAIDKKTKYISAYSVSRKLLENLQIMLGFGFGIYSKITKPTKCETNNRGSKNILQGYTICIKSDGAVKFANEMRLFIDYKQARLDEMAKASTKSSEVNDVIPTFVHNGKVHTNMNRKKLAAIIGANPFPDVRFDKIVSIEEIPNPTEWMYDFTVEETRTFIVENGMALFDTFHTAGSGVAMKANVTRGVPRIEELLSITENPKNSSLTICLKKDEETDCERAKELIAQIELTQLSELVESISICFDPDDLNTLIQEDRSTMLQYYEYQRMLNECAGIPEEAEADPNDSARSKWIIRMVMSREAMLDKRITMDDVHFAIKNSHGDDVSCIYADYNADKLVFRLRMNNINGKKPLKPKENPLDQSDKIYLLKAFQDQLLNNIVLRGLKNIKKVTLRKLMDTLHKEDGAYVKKETWVLDTKGTNLMDVLALDYIDVNRTISDDIQEIHSVLGIEAAREALLTEMTGVFENDGTYINYHHLSLLCDRMTASSHMVSIFRHGINNDNIGPIAKASFEETPEMFLKAARHAELDQMRGISANVMCGQEGYYGTSSFQVMLDLPQMIAKMEDVAFQAQNEQEEIAEAMGSAAMDTSACAFEKLTIESNVGSIQKVDLGHGADNYNVGF
jgi:DNA-directed RNA polymerase II subunit RPB1